MPALCADVSKGPSTVLGAKQRSLYKVACSPVFVERALTRFGVVFDKVAKCQVNETTKGY